MHIRKLAHRIPGLPRLVRAMRRVYDTLTIDPEDVFTRIYRGNLWGGTASVSGTGSGLDQTAGIVREVPRLARDLHVASLLDVPCGDFHWMRTADLAGIEYIGGDIVRELVATNAARYAKPGVTFRHLDLIKDALPACDLILCRDCLVHLSYGDARRALLNMIRSGARYVLLTTFTGREANTDIRTGQWRPLNLERPPFSFPPPERLVIEGCTGWNGKYRDKSLGLWRVEQLRLPQ